MKRFIKTQEDLAEYQTKYGVKIKNATTPCMVLDPPTPGNGTLDIGYEPIAFPNAQGSATPADAKANAYARYQARWKGVVKNS